LEDLVNSDGANWRGRSVLVTGHTGFKGAWLSLWLADLGAQVHGYALDPPTEPNLFAVARVKARLASDTRADLADLAALNAAMTRARPEVIFHLAAQPLVREGYSDPLRTLNTNVIGTAHLLEALRATNCARAAVLVATDKALETLEKAYAYAEVDPLGGYDPYSASKAAAEIVAASYRVSFFGDGSGSHAAKVATARSGNVIGGGDWAADRLVPDCIRAFIAGEPVRLRNPQSVRPWQHVLEPLAGYLRLAERLLARRGGDFAKAWNFGPNAGDTTTVAEVAWMTAKLWEAGARVELERSPATLHEAGLLSLDSTQAHEVLGWHPRWALKQALAKTVAWYRVWREGADMSAFSAAQIRDYAEAKVPA